jgi:serine/threonine-protein kinase
MSAQRWQRLEAFFERGTQLQGAERERWLKTLPDEAELVVGLRAMLLADVATDRLDHRIAGAIAPAHATPLAGGRLGAWRLLGELGSGGVGVVYLAERAEGGFRQQAAIKVIRSLGDGNAAQQLRHER